MKLFRSVDIFGSLVLAVLTGCSTAARDVSRNDAPEAQVTLSSAEQPARVGAVLQGSYRYSDADDDSEKNTLKAWLRDGQPIDGADQDNYTATAQDSGKNLQFRVTPAAASGKSPGAAVVSSGITIENSAPVVTLAPLVGAASAVSTGVGSVLRVDFTYSDVDNDPTASAEIRWLRRAASAQDEIAIPTATNNTYTVTWNDLNHSLVAEVTPIAQLGIARGKTERSAPVVIVNTVPVAGNVVLTANAMPATVGSKLTASFSYFDADLDAEAVDGHTLQWLRNGLVVAGVTTPTYTLTAPGDVEASFQFTVTPRASLGFSPGVSVTSNTLTVVNSAPQASNVVVSGANANSAVVDAVLSASYNYSDLDQNPKGTSLYRWYRGASLIPGATALQYTVTAADLNNDLVFEVTPVATLGTSPGAAVRSTPPIRVNNSAPLAKNVTLSTITPPAVVGSKLTASYDYFDADGDAQGASGIRWLSNGAAIASAQGLSYNLLPGDSGKTITFEVTPKATAGVLSGSATLSNGIVTGNSAPTATAVIIAPNTAQVKTLLTARFTYTDLDNDPQGASAYEWSNGTTVLGTGTTYTVTAADAHKTLTVKVTPVATTGTSPGAAVTSLGITLANSPPSITGVVIDGSVAGKVYTGLTLRAKYAFQDADGDGEGGSTYQWYSGTTSLGGETALAYTVRLSDVGQPLTVQVTPKDNFVPALSGTPVTSAAITPVNLAPEVSNVVVNGKAVNQAGEVLSVNYDYSDHEKDAQSTAGRQFRWLRDGATITSAVSNRYILTLADAGKTIAAEVTPLAQTGTLVGLPVSSSVTVQPANVALNAVSAGLKQLRFSWTLVPGASFYQVSYSPAEGAGFVPVSTTSSNITTTTYDWDIGVHRINWPKAQFMLEACDANNTCLPSASISALNVMLGAIGYFKASNTEAGDWFGYTVALSADGNTLAVGAFLESSAGIGGNPVDDCAAAIPVNCAKVSGAVYVYTRSGIIWSQQAYLKASNPGTGDYFSSSVALSADGNTLAVGAYGEASSTIGINSTPNELAAYAGAVYVFTRNTTTTAWSQQAYVKALNAGAGDFFGTSVALSNDGNTLAVGATGEASNTTGINSTPNELATNAGAVYVFTRSAAWSQQAYVKASNSGELDSFGQSVALSADGNTLAVAAVGENSSSTGINSTPDELSDNAGAVYVYTRSSITSGWGQADAYLKASNAGASDFFGISVALSNDGNTLAVGANYEDSAAIGSPLDDCSAVTPANCAKDSGAVYVYTRSTSGWLQEAYVKASNTGAGDYFGQSVALSANGNMLAVGAFFESSSSTGINRTPNELAYAAGAVYVLTRSGTAWTQQAYVKASNTNTYDYFGRSIALSADGNTLAVGAHPEGSKATGVNNTVPGQSDNSAPAAGAVYLY